MIIRDKFSVAGRGHFTFVGVLDGHGGRTAAIFTRDHLFDILCAELQAGVEPSQALTNAYLKTDKMFISACRGGTAEHPTTSTPAAFPMTPQPTSTTQLPASSEHRRQHSASLAVKIPHEQPKPASVPLNGMELSDKDTSGTTAVCMLLHHDTYTLYVSNVGDSRAVLFGSNGAISLTNDHKADRPDEMDRIRRAGGFVVHKRVMGELAISRAIGDLDFKETGFLFVLPDPELCTYHLSATDEFVLLACDGIYDVMSNEQACQFIKERLASGRTPEEASADIVKHAIETLNTRDNVTVIIVKLPTPDELKAAGVHAHTSQSQPTLHDSHIATPIAPVTNTSSAVSTPQAFPTSLQQAAFPNPLPVTAPPPTVIDTHTNMSKPSASQPPEATHPVQSHITRTLSPHYSHSASDNEINFHDEFDGDGDATMNADHEDSKHESPSSRSRSTSRSHSRDKSDEKEQMHQQQQEQQQTYQAIR